MKFEKSKLEPVEIEINGTKYPARLPFRACVELEEMFNMSFLKVFDKFADMGATAEEITSVLYVILKHGGVELEKEDLLDIEFSIDVMEGISAVLMRASKVVSKLQGQSDAGKLPAPMTG